MAATVGIVVAVTDLLLAPEQQTDRLIIGNTSVALSIGSLAGGIGLSMKGVRPTEATVL